MHVPQVQKHNYKFLHIYVSSLWTFLFTTAVQFIDLNQVFITARVSYNVKHYKVLGFLSISFVLRIGNFFFFKFG